MLALHINGAKLFVLQMFLSLSCTGVRPKRALVTYLNRGKYKIIYNFTFSDRCHLDLPVNVAHGRNYGLVHKVVNSHSSKMISY